MGLNPKSQAESLFAQIGYGRENAMPRPLNASIDRHLRNLVTKANEHGDVIINVGNGYYRPRPWILAEKMEYEEYIAKDISRAMRVLQKKKKMQKSYERMEEEHEFAAERSQSGEGACESYQQLRLSL